MYHPLFIGQFYIKLINQLKVKQSQYLYIMTKSEKFYAKGNTITNNLIIATITLNIQFVMHHISYFMTNIQPCNLDLITTCHQKQILIWFIPSLNVTIKILYIKLKSCQMIRNANLKPNNGVPAKNTIV